MVQAVKHGILEVILRRKTALTVIVDTWADAARCMRVAAGWLGVETGDVSGPLRQGSGDVEGTLMMRL